MYLDPKLSDASSTLIVSALSLLFALGLDTPAASHFLPSSNYHQPVTTK